jgi:hypothetical protein
MQLQTVINNSSRANLFLVHQAITTHYRGLTPAEREKGFDAYLQSNHMRMT